MLSAMETRRWVNHGHPQTLQIAVLLSYINAAFNVLFGFAFLGIGLLFTVGDVAAGLGIANEKRPGYYLGIVVSVGWVLFVLTNGADPISILIAAARVALLLHPQSRDYQRIWFR